MREMDPDDICDYYHYKRQIMVFKRLHKTFSDWCKCLPVLAFNGSRYDINVIRRHLLPMLQAMDTTPIHVIKNGNSYKMIKTSRLKFLDVTFYLAAGTSYAQWLKAFNIEQRKFHWPHEWFTSLDLLDQDHVPDIAAFTSSLNNIGLTQAEYDNILATWQREGFRTMRDMLEYYNNLDVVPFLQALQKLMDYWWDSEGIDMFDCVSIPGLAERVIMKTRSPFSYFMLPQKPRPKKTIAPLLAARTVLPPDSADELEDIDAVVAPDTPPDQRALQYGSPPPPSEPMTPAQSPEPTMEVSHDDVQLQRLVDGCDGQETNIADIPFVGSREYHAALAKVVREIFDDNMTIPPDPAKQAKDNSDYEQLMKQSIVGGPAIIFNRLVRTGTTIIRPDLFNRLVRLIIGFDCVSILMQSFFWSWVFSFV